MILKTYAPAPHDRSLEFNPNLVSTPRQDATGQPVYGPSETSGYISPTVAGNFPPRHGANQPQMFSTPPNMSMQQQMGQVQVNPVHEAFPWIASARHDAIYLVVGRILYEFWHRSLIKSADSDGPDSAKIVNQIY